MNISEIIKGNGLLNLGSNLVVKSVTDVGSTDKYFLEITILYSRPTELFLIPAGAPQTR